MSAKSIGMQNSIVEIPGLKIRVERHVMRVIQEVRIWYANIWYSSIYKVG